MKQEYRLFGLWRLIAALLVMAYHYSHYAANALEVIAWFEHMGPLLDMFFILSGFLIFDRYGWTGMDPAGYLRFLARRLSRLYPLHLVTLSFFVLVAVAVNLGWVHSEGGQARYDFAALPSNILLTQAWGLHNALTFNYVSWSLSAEWFAYLCFPLLLVAFRFGRIPGLALLLAGVVACLEFADAGVTDHRELWYEAKLWGAYRVLADFVFGALIAALARRFPIALDGLASAWLAMAAAVAWMFADLSFYPVIALVGFAIYLGACAEKAHPDISTWMQPLMPVASLSFGIYLWHPILEAVFLSFGWRRLLEPAAVIPFWLYVFIPAVLTILVAAFSARNLEAPLAKRLDTGFKKLFARVGLADPGRVTARS